MAEPNGASVPSYLISPKHWHHCQLTVSWDSALLGFCGSHFSWFSQALGNSILHGCLTGSVPRGLVFNPHLFSLFISFSEWSHLLTQTDKTHISISRPGPFPNFRFCFLTLSRTPPRCCPQPFHNQHVQIHHATRLLSGSVLPSASPTLVDSLSPPTQSSKSESLVKAWKCLIHHQL